MASNGSFHSSQTYSHYLKCSRYEMLASHVGFAADAHDKNSLTDNPRNPFRPASSSSPTGGLSEMPAPKQEDTPGQPRPSLKTRRLSLCRKASEASGLSCRAASENRHSSKMGRKCRGQTSIIPRPSCDAKGIGETGQRGASRHNWRDGSRAPTRIRRLSGGTCPRNWN